MDIQTGYCYSTAPSGQSFISLAVQNDASLLVDAVTLKTDNPFIAGQTYQVSFFLMANNDFGGFGDSILVGLSDVNNSFGQRIYAHFPNLTAWDSLTFTFTAPLTGQYLSVQNQGAVYGWTFVDDFRVLSEVEGVEASHLADINVFTTGSDLICNAPFAITQTNVFNAVGQQVASSSSRKNVTLNTTNWSRGLYIVQCFDESGNSYLKKVLR